VSHFTQQKKASGQWRLGVKGRDGAPRQDFVSEEAIRLMGNVHCSGSLAAPASTPAWIDLDR